MTSSQRKAKKQSKKSPSKRWECSENCDNSVSACKHLERELAKVYARNSVHSTPTDGIDRFPNDEGSYARELQAIEMNAKLYDYALPELHRQVILMHIVYACSFSTIAYELGIPNKQTAHKIFKRSMELLRERGYGLK